MLYGVRTWWGKHKISFAAMTLAVAPSLFVSSTVPDAFSAATDIAVSREREREYYTNTYTHTLSIIDQSSK